jgi:hypothetical protein
MSVPRLSVAVVIERIPLTHRWASEQWRVAAVEPDDASRAPPVRLADHDGHARWRETGFMVELHRSEADGYYLNVSTPEPKAFVMWRPDEDANASGGPLLRPYLVTASYHEASRLLDGGEQVDAVALDPALIAWVEVFVVEHYRPESKRKSRRNPLYERERSRGGEAPAAADSADGPAKT